MQVGRLGNIIFEVSDKLIKTVQDVKYSGGAAIETHSRHLKKGLPEFTGVDLESLSFKFRSSKYLGTDPDADIKQIKQYVNTGESLVFVVGKDVIGYRWMIEKYQVQVNYYDANAVPIDAEISLTLKEYPKE